MYNPNYPSVEPMDYVCFISCVSFKSLNPVLMLGRIAIRLCRLKRYSFQPILDAMQCVSTTFTNEYRKRNASLLSDTKTGKYRIQ
jgi:hypothetical protein